ncbi:hypothetical protein D3C86_2104770 [compost metagenome]
MRKPISKARLSSLTVKAGNRISRLSGSSRSAYSLGHSCLVLSMKKACSRGLICFFRKAR